VATRRRSLPLKAGEEEEVLSRSIDCVNKLRSNRRAALGMALRGAGVVIVLVMMLSPVVFGQGGDGSNAAGEAPLKHYELVNGRWFDGREFQEGTFYTHDGRLTKTKPAVVHERIDLKGGYVVPPFGEAHNHNVEGPWNLDGVAARYLHDGVFYVKNPNSIREFTARIAPRINTPASIDVVFANAGLTSSGGHPVPLYEQVLRESRYRAVIGEVPPGWFNDRGYVVIDSGADIHNKWSRIVVGKPDFIKVFLVHSEDRASQGHEDRPHGRRGLDPELVPLIVARAHQAGLRVAAHVETATDFRLALSAGVDEMAHVPGWFLAPTDQDSRMLLTEEDARLAAKAGVIVTTTTVAMKPAEGGHGHHAPHHDPHGAHSQGGHAFSMDATVWQRAEAVQRHNIGLLYRHGVKLVIGSDHAETSLAEAQHLHELGLFDNLSLLKLWCEDTPRAIFPDRRISRLQEDYEASFLVLRDNPLERFEAVTGIEHRMKQGHIVAVEKGGPWTH
jgi:imidazolonepropionase-like amidohydrolase